MIGRLLTKLKKSYHRRGALGTVRYVFQRVARPLLDLTPAKRREWRRRAESDREFDSRYGVDTGGFIQLNRFHIPSENWEYGTPYGAIHPEDFARAMDALDVRHEEYTFVDFGSGKGRALLLASDYPFKKIVGVEFTPDLVEIAKKNVSVFRRDSQRCRDIEPVCADALKYELPEGPSVFYFYNPFDREVMERMVAKVARSYRENPREICVLYVNPLLGDLWEGAGCFKTVTRNGDYAIYKANV
jgi:SAM-dependent methyltransferase